jgi:hypothetical protein
MAKSSVLDPPAAVPPPVKATAPPPAHPSNIPAPPPLGSTPAPTAPKSDGIQPQAAPPVLGKTPTSINQLYFNSGKKGTHFTGPVCSGGGKDPFGSALEVMVLQVDYSMGGFSLPIVFPTDAILLWVNTLSVVAFAGGTGDASISLGTAASGADILGISNPGVVHATTIHPVLRSLPLNGIDTNPGQCYLTFGNSSATSGLALVMILYARCAMKWS